MKVICINNSSLVSHLVLGKEYEVLEDSDTYFLVLGKDGIPRWHHKSRFKKSNQEEEVDELKLKQDMIDFLIKENKSLKEIIVIGENRSRILKESTNLLIGSIVDQLERIPRMVRYLLGVGTLTKSLSEYIKDQKEYESSRGNQTNKSS